jgi:hypothetical protein
LDDLRGVTMNITNLDNKIKSQLTIDYMNAVYAVSKTNQTTDYLFKIKQYKKARYLKRLLEGSSHGSLIDSINSK